MPVQADWCFCRKCFELFFNGFAQKGQCPGGGEHDASGFNFHLPYATYETGNGQHDWRYCQKCHAMFFDGYTQKGQCTAGGEHEAQGFNFTLPHDTVQTATAQPGWRHCDKCHVMFFNGFPIKGICKAGGDHHAQGWLFVLPHDLPSFLDFSWTPIVISGGVPVGGWAHLTIRSDGSYVWSGRFHDSGFPSYNVSIAWGVKDSQNTLYGFSDTGHTAGTVEPGSRDHDWNIEGHNDKIAERWGFIAAGSSWHADAKANIDLGVIVNEVKAAVGVVTEVVSVVGSFL